MANTADYIAARIDLIDDCWIWKSPRKDGYGTIRAKERRGQLVHRASYEIHVGPIPDELQIDHLCRNRACCNPEHLEPVTQRENLARGLQQGLKTHCKHGHEYTGSNVGVRSDGRRYCRACDNARSRDYHRRMKER